MLNNTTQNIMKKLLFTTAIISLLFAGCNKDNDPIDEQDDPPTEQVKKLPSRMTLLSHADYYEDNDTTTFFIILEYDDSNRLVKQSTLGRPNGDIGLEIWYNADNTPSKMIENWVDGTENQSLKTEFQYVGNSIFSITIRQGFCNDTTILKLNGDQIVETVRCGRKEVYSYNSNGNVSQINSMDFEYSNIMNFEYSNIKSIFRHTNTPDWFFLLMEERLGPFSKNGYMVSKMIWSNGHTNSFVYKTNSDGYVAEMKIFENERLVQTIGIEYIPAK